MSETLSTFFAILPFLKWTNDPWPRAHNACPFSLSCLGQCVIVADRYLGKEPFACKWRQRRPRRRRRRTALIYAQILNACRRSRFMARARAWRRQRGSHTRSGRPRRAVAAAQPIDGFSPKRFQPPKLSNLLHLLCFSVDSRQIGAFYDHSGPIWRRLTSSWCAGRRRRRRPSRRPGTPCTSTRLRRRYTTTPSARRRSGRRPPTPCLASQWPTPISTSRTATSTSPAIPPTAADGCGRRRPVWSPAHITVIDNVPSSFPPRSVPFFDSGPR